MQDIIKKLQALKRDANAIKRKAQKSLSSAPETGRLRIIKKPTRGTPQFYLVTNTKKNNGRYLSKKNHRSVIKSYLQREYDRQTIEKTTQLTTAIDTFLQTVPAQTLAHLCEAEPWQQEFITPHILNDAEYIAQWRSVTYTGSAFPTATNIR